MKTLNRGKLHMEFILTYRTNNSVGYEITAIYGDSLDLALFNYEGSQDDIISIVRVF